MARYTERAGGLPKTIESGIVNAVAKGVEAAQRLNRRSAMNPLEERKKEYISGLQKEAALSRAFTTEAGLRKIECGLATQ